MDLTCKTLYRPVNFMLKQASRVRPPLLRISSGPCPLRSGE